MFWQDLILTIGNVIFIIALVPSILSKDKPAILTSILSFLVLMSFAGVYVSLSLWASAVFIFITSILWLILAIQKYNSNRLIKK